MQQQEPQKDKEEDLIIVTRESSLGNFIPSLIAIKKGYLTQDNLDEQGYNVLHHAVTQNNIAVVIQLIEVYKFDINKKSNKMQTALMLASYFGYLPLVKYLLDNGAQVNIIDNISFSSLLYSIKGQKDIVFFYLLHRGADIKVKDLNGCSVAHWAAHMNNLFLLEFLQRIGLNLFELDLQGYTPFQRAIFNESYDCVKYLIQINPSIIISYDTEVLKSESLRNIIKSKKNELLNNSCSFSSLKQQYRENASNITIVVYMLIACLLYYSYVIRIIYRTMGTSILYGLTVIFNILLFALIPYLFHYQKSPSANQFIRSNNSNKKTIQSQFTYQMNNPSSQNQGQTKEDYDILDDDDTSQMLGIDFSNINKVLTFSLTEEQNSQEKKNGKNKNLYNDDNDDNDENTQDNNNSNVKNNNNSGNNNNQEGLFIEFEDFQNQNKDQLQNQQKQEQYQFIKETFLHKIIKLIEEEKYSKVAQFSNLNLCAQCLEIKSQRCAHCPVCDVCIPYYNHHSFFFNKCVSRKNHLNYYLLILIQQILLTLYIFFYYTAFKAQFDSYFPLFVFEIPYIIYNFESHYQIVLLSYILALILLYQNSLDLIIETYGILKNLTRYEIFNRQKCTYFYENSYQNMYTKILHRYYKNKFCKGIIKNIVNYLKEQE